MIHLFSYGTLQQDGVQMASFGRLLKGAADALPGWKREMVEITDPDVLAKRGRAFIPSWFPEPSPMKWRAWCSKSRAAELASADRYEVADYKRIARAAQIRHRGVGVCEALAARRPKIR